MHPLRVLPILLSLRSLEFALLLGHRSHARQALFHESARLLGRLNHSKHARISRAGTLGRAFARRIVIIGRPLFTRGSLLAGRASALHAPASTPPRQEQQPLPRLLQFGVNALLLLRGHREQLRLERGHLPLRPLRLVGGALFLLLHAHLLRLARPLLAQAHERPHPGLEGPVHRLVQAGVRVDDHACSLGAPRGHLVAAAVRAEPAGRLSDEQPDVPVQRAPRCRHLGDAHALESVHELQARLALAWLLALSQLRVLVVLVHVVLVRSTEALLELTGGEVRAALERGREARAWEVATHPFRQRLVHLASQLFPAQPQPFRWCPLLFYTWRLLGLQNGTAAAPRLLFLLLVLHLCTLLLRSSLLGYLLGLLGVVRGRREPLCAGRGRRTASPPPRRRRHRTQAGKHATRASRGLGQGCRFRFRSLTRRGGLAQRTEWHCSGSRRTLFAAVASCACFLVSPMVGGPPGVPDAARTGGGARRGGLERYAKSLHKVSAKGATYAGSLCKELA